jgi:hypothetical protein
MFGSEYDKIWIPAITAMLVAIVNHFQKGRADLLSRRADRLSQQLEKLYGPLLLFASENAGLMSGMVKPADPSQPVDTSLEQYARQCIEKNNAAIAELLKTNLAYIDPRDIGLFVRFVNDRHLHLAFKDVVPAQKVETVVPLTRWQFSDVAYNRFNEYAREWRDLTYGWWGRLRRRQYTRVQPETQFLAPRNEPPKST